MKSSSWWTRGVLAAALGLATMNCGGGGASADTLDPASLEEGASHTLKLKYWMKGSGYTGDERVENLHFDDAANFRPLVTLTAVAAALALVASACIDATSGSQASTGAVLVADPAEVALPISAVGQTVTAKVLLENTGPGVARIDALVVEGDAGFAVGPGEETPALPWTLDEGDRVSVEIRYTAADREPSEATLKLVGEGLDDVPFALPLRAAPIAPREIEAQPDALDFGLAIVGSPVVRDLLLNACGEAPITIASLAIEGPDAASFTVADPGGPPLSPSPRAPVSRCPSRSRPGPTRPRPGSPRPRCGSRPTRGSTSTYPSRATRRARTAPSRSSKPSRSPGCRSRPSPTSTDRTASVPRPSWSGAGR